MRSFEFVCSKCLIHEDFFKIDWGGVDNCPKCGGTDRTQYRELGFYQKLKARSIKEECERKEVRKHVLKMTAFGYVVIAIALIILLKGAF